MNIEVNEEPITTLAEYARIPIAFEVSRIFDVTIPEDDVSRTVLTERPHNHPYLKDYDTIEKPVTWPSRFDMTTWAVFAARIEGHRVGGAIVAFNTSGLEMLEGRTDIAMLWDLRVAPEARGQGAGSALFHAAENWARAKGCRGLQIETQNINVPACRFYARHGCVIRAVDRFAYPELPDEIQLIWYKDLF